MTFTLLNHISAVPTVNSYGQGGMQLITSVCLPDHNPVVCGVGAIYLGI